MLDRLEGYGDINLFSDLDSAVGEGLREGVVVKKCSGVGDRGVCIHPPVDAKSLFQLGLDCVEGEAEGEAEGELE